MPSDITTAQISGERLTAPLNVLPPANEQKFEAQIVDTVLNCLYSSKQPYILVDGLAAPDQIIDEVNEFARVTGLPTLSYTFGGGIMDGPLPNYHGVNAGNFGTLDFTPYTNTSDLALVFSPFLTNVNTQGGTLVSEKNITISFCRKKIEIGHETHTLHVKNFLRRLLDKLDTSQSPKPAKAALLPKIRDTPSTSAYLHYFKPQDIIVCANVTPLLGGRDFVLPPSTTLINSPIWLSIGHMLPAAQGASLVQRELKTGGRTILFEGDGSFQAPAQELSTIIKYKLDVIIFLTNNDGYIYERTIHGEEHSYNDIARWRCLMTPEIMGAPRKGESDWRRHVLCWYLGRARAGA